MAPDPSVLISPAESKLESLSHIDPDGWISDKKVLGRERRVHLSELFKSEEEGLPYHGGWSVKLYLAPWNLHFLLFPASGRVISYRYRAGWAVPLLFVRQGDVLNERLCIHFQTEWGFSIGIILVGSWMVNGIHHAFETGRDYDKGADLGHFKVGSTVILVVPPYVEWSVPEGAKLQLGQEIGKITGTDSSGLQTSGKIAPPESP